MNEHTPVKMPPLALPVCLYQQPHHDPEGHTMLVKTLHLAHVSDYCGLELGIQFLINGTQSFHAVDV